MHLDGVSKHKGEEYDYEFGYTDYEYVGNSTFIIKKYNPEFRTHVYAVMMAKNPEEVEQYSAIITLFKGSFETICKCPIIPIEQLPPEELINHEGSWSVHYSLLRKFFYFEDKGENNNHDWEVRYNWKIEIVKK